VQLEGIHHVTCITADAPANVDFYVRVLGLRMVKKTVNQDDPTVYHLFYADEDASAGADITFFEYPGTPRGRAGAGMVHRIVFRVSSPESLDFWEQRLSGEGVTATREDGMLVFADPEGLELALEPSAVADAPLRAIHPDVPEQHALCGFDRVHAFARDPGRSRSLLEQTLGFRPVGGDAWEARGTHRGGRYVYDEPPALPGIPGAGTVHHVAWASTMDDHAEWQARVAAAGARPTPVIDRFYFRSIYFREPSGVLFEIATLGPGFATDEPADHLGERLSLPPAFEHLRDRLAGVLTPLPDPATLAGSRSGG
jgi:glyoxalase family protein